ncbi:MAG: 3-hydroxyisobutyrate dehydrogenase [Belnapia sp.]|nr:3-hydroxyisobutyrate dehydrogenase [Belnapia sp.]
MAHIGIAGLGRMGGALAARLLELGHQVTVWNRSAAKCAPLVAAGASLAESPAALAGAAGTIITILTDAAAIEAVYGGAQGILAADLTGRQVIEMSTVRPETPIALAPRVAARGGEFIECPVGGTTAPARQGKLLGLAAGDPAAVARARPLLDQLCRRVEHVGPVGAGASMKLAINLPLALYYQTLGEAVTLCAHLGHDPEWLMELFSDTTGGANVLKIRGPLIGRGLKGEDLGPTAFDIDGIRKDLRTMLAEAAARGAELPMTRTALAAYDGASAAGWGGRDGAAMPAWWPSQAKA